MFLLDTNVVSDLMRPEPERTVEAWVAGQAPKDLWGANSNSSRHWVGGAKPRMMCRSFLQTVGPSGDPPHTANPTIRRVH